MLCEEQPQVPFSFAQGRLSTRLSDSLRMTIERGRGKGGLGEAHFPGLRIETWEPGTLEWWYGRLAISAAWSSRCWGLWLQFVWGWVTGYDPSRRRALALTARRKASPQLEAS